MKSDEIVLKYRKLKFVIPRKTECFWPYYGICFVGEYDQLLRNIKKTDVVLDAGANIGIFSLLAAQKASMVLAVEADPRNYNYLIKNIELNNADNIIPVNEAVSDYVGEGYISGQGLTATLSKNGDMPIKVTTVDELLKRLSVDSIDIVKMDIEGSESKALSGHYLANVRELMIEVHDSAGYSKVTKVLKLNGFIIREWNLSYRKVLRNIFSDAIDFIRSEFKMRFLALRLVLGYIFRLNPHPIPSADELSQIRILYATRNVIV